MGMGGSSLFPEVLARTFGRHRAGPGCTCSTPPTRPPSPGSPTRARRSARSTSRRRSRAPPSRPAATSSGPGTRGRRPGRFAVVTDPGSELGALARERGFAEVFENRPDIGGRYSALSLFGLVPALLDGRRRGGPARRAASTRSRDSGPDVDPASQPGARSWRRALAGGVRRGRDKATFVLDPDVETFGLWLEQLVAESLGKDGTGVVPIVGEPLGDPEVYGDDRALPRRQVPIDALEAAGHPVLVGGSDASRPRPSGTWS